MKSFRFNLATLLVAIGVLACALGYLVQAGFAEALFKIQSNQLAFRGQRRRIARVLGVPMFDRCFPSRILTECF